MKKIILISIAILVVVGSIVFFFMDKGDQEKKLPVTTSQTVEETPSVEPTQPPAPPIERAPFPKEFENDLDQDGLLNEEEKKLGTNELEVDTDGDGLSDSNEVKRWKTDPTKPDTDGDGYYDLFEIMGGYNPNGQGKLTQ